MKLFRFSGYIFMGYDETAGGIAHFLDVCFDGDIRQLHIEEGGTVTDEDAKEIIENKNVDLAKLAKHFQWEPSYEEYMRELPKEGELWTHFKGKTVEIICVAEDTEHAGERFVIYKHLASGREWARPLDMFMSEVDREKYPDVEQVYRFERVKKDENEVDLL